MTRYISVKDALNAMCDSCDVVHAICAHYPCKHYEAVECTPSADVVEVVRCKDCKHYDNGFCYNPNTYDDEKTRGNTIPNWFCADGERREE